MISHRFEGKNDHQSNLSGVQLLQVQAVEYGSCLQREAHFHTYTQLVYVFNGEGICQIEEDSVNLADGDLLLINPQMSHHGLRAREGVLSAITLDLCCAFPACVSTAMPPPAPAKAPGNVPVCGCTSISILPSLLRWTTWPSMPT